MNDKAIKLLKSHDAMLEDLPYQYPQKARANIAFLVEQILICIRIGYEDFANALTIVLVRAVRLRRSE